MKARLTPFELNAILKSQGCECTEQQRSRRGEGCTRSRIRCNGRLKWMAEHDEKFRKVWKIGTEKGIEQ